MLRRIFPLVICLLTLTLLALGCSDDDDTTPTGPGAGITGHDFVDIAAMAEAIAPPVYSAPIAAPGDPDSIWTQGDYPLLGKVFSENEPMSLHSNLNNLDQAVNMLQQVYNAFDSLGLSGDTSFSPDTTMSVVTESLTTLTGIPTMAQEAFGLAAVQLQRVFKSEFYYQGDTMLYHLGYLITPISETYLTWFDWNGAQQRETNLYYANVNLIDSSIDIRGAFYKEATQETATWTYHIETVDTVDFAYKMGWYSDNWGNQTGFGSVIGGGNRDTLFAMRYRQWSPADTSEYDSIYALDQMFDSAYTYLGATIATSLQDHIVADSMFAYSSQPTAYIPSPWE